MNRRTFLRILAGTASVIAVAPTYFLPPMGGWPKVDPRITEYQRMILRFVECMTAPDPETAMGQQQFWYTHPAHYEAVQKLKFDGMLWVPETEEPGAATYAGIERMSASKGLTA